MTDVDLFDPATAECPYAAYARLREEAPAWREPAHRHVRDHPLRRRAHDRARHRARSHSALLARPRSTRAASGSRRCTRSRGWVPGADAGRPRRPRAPPDAGAVRPRLPPGQDQASSTRSSSDLAHRLIDDFIDAGTLRLGAPVRRPAAADRHRQADGRAGGGHLADQGLDGCVGAAPRDDADRGGRWSGRPSRRSRPSTTSSRSSSGCAPSPTTRCSRDLVNTEIPEWGRPLTDNELHAEMMAGHVRRRVGDHHERAVGRRAAADRATPTAWEQAQGRPDTYVAAARRGGAASRGAGAGPVPHRADDVELHGVTIPAGAVLNVRFAVGQPRRAPLRRARPTSISTASNAAPHLAFGVGDALLPRRTAGPSRAVPRVPGARRARRRRCGSSRAPTTSATSRTSACAR